jgi:hypothetical protein
MIHKFALSWIFFDLAYSDPYLWDVVIFNEES